MMTHLNYHCTCVCVGGTYIVPIVGMQCGNSLAGVSVLLSFLLKELE